MLKRPVRRIALLALPLLASACVLEFKSGLFQSLTLHFTLSQDVPSGASSLVHSIHYPFEVTVKGRWVRISGSLMAPRGGALPDRVMVESRFEDAVSARLRNRMRAGVQIGADGTFSVQQKVRKNILAGTMQRVSVEPEGAALAEGTHVWICVDVVKKKKDLASLPDCVAGDDGGGPPPSPSTLVVEVQDNAFSPQRVRVQPGTTVRWVLTGQALNHTVTAMDSSVFDGLLPSAGSFFEVTFTGQHLDQTFEYFCRAHQACCAMQGSVQVGDNAPDPGDGY